MPDRPLATCPACKSQFPVPVNLIVVSCPACGQRVTLTTPIFQRATP